MMFALVACSYDDLGSIPQQPTADGPVQVRFSVQVPDMLQATRTMSSQEITSLKLVVFDENGYFVDDADATLIDYTGDGENKVAVEVESDDDTPADSSKEQTYTVSLPQSASPRTIHFIANLPEGTKFEYGSERELINALETSGTADAYWQRKELSSILGKVVGQNDEGKPIVEATDELAAELNKIPLVRNFAKVSVDSEDVKSVFTNVQIAVFNAPQRGKIAPYNTNAGEWAAYSATTSYDNLTAAGYYGYVPTFDDDDFANVGIDANGVISGTTQYLYEYNMDGKKIEAGSKYPFVIIAGSYQGHAPSYYKVDLVDASGKYLNILRNFDYTVVIESVSGDGYSSAAAAAAAAASNNINASIDTRNLLNISDGIGRLYVEYTTKYITDVTKPFTLKYKYVPSIQNQNTVDNDYVTTGSPTTTNPVDLSKVVAGDVIASYSVAGSDDADGWRTITITPKAEYGKQQEITISASTMSRTVKLHTVNPYALAVICPETVASSVGQPVQITLQVPENLPEAIFPLEFVIVSDQLSPDASLENMPVRTGLNADGTEGGQHYGFVKTITYEEYQQLTAVAGKVNIECNFKLSVAASVQGDVTTVNAYNPYFTCTPGSFVNVIPKKFTNVALSGNIGRYGAGQTGALTFNTTNAEDVVTVTLTGLQPADNNTVTLTPVEGKENTYTVTGSASYTINVKTTDWGTEPAAKLTADGYAEATADADRNILYIPAGKISWSSVGSTSYSVALVRLNGHDQLENIGTGGNNTRSNNEVNIVVEGLSSTEELYLGYRIGNRNGRYSTTTFTVQDVLSTNGVSNIGWTSNSTRPNYNN